MGCAAKTFTCPAKSTCKIVDGSYKCECDAGYEGKDCTDVDECAANKFTCPPKSKCKNVNGAYDRECDAGYAGPKCAEIDECLPNPCANGGTCTDGLLSFTCECAGDWLGKTCEEAPVSSNSKAAETGTA